MNSLENSKKFLKELRFSTSRSAGPGGQNVNKISSKVELRFNISNSRILSEQEKSILTEKLKKRITKEGDLLIVSQTERTQMANKVKVIQKFYQLIEKALTPEKERKATKPSKLAKEERLGVKKIRALKKELRRRPNY